VTLEAVAAGVTASAPHPLEEQLGGSRGSDLGSDSDLDTSDKEEVGAAGVEDGWAACGSGSGRQHASCSDVPAVVLMVVMKQ
jgi:hypothetical protein